MKKINKKAQSERDFSIVIILLFTTGIFFIISAFIGINLIQEFMSQVPDVEVVQIAEQKFLDSFLIFDNIFVFLMIFLLIGVGITSYKLSTNKVFFLISFIMAGIYGFIAYFFSYIFGQIVSFSVFNATTLIFPKTIMICSNLHWVSLALVIISSITLYAKKDSEFQPLT